MQRRTRKIELEYFGGTLTRPQPRDRTGLAQTHAVPESLSRERESAARLRDREERAAERSRAEPARDHVAEHLAADDERPRAAEDDLFGAAGAVLPLAMTVAISALEILVAFLQAYVFAVLTCMYLNDAIHPGH